jgi:hypothetical protein
LIDVVFRVFNDGIGFRYEFPEQEGFKHFIVADELTQFNLSTNNKTFWIPGIMILMNICTIQPCSQKFTL